MKPICLLAAALLAHSVLTMPAEAAPGGLDPTFGSGGSVNRANANDRIEAMALQSDGKIVVAGTWTNGSNDDFMATRYTASGSLDTTFNGSGRATIEIGSDTDRVTCVAIQSDGKVLVGGFSYAANANFALARLNADGSLDTSFNGTGKVTTDISGYDFARAIAVQSDGKIVLVGGNNSVFVVVRYNSNGSLDTSFNSTGKVTTDFGGGWDEALDVAIQGDGRIVVAGQYQHAVSNDYYRFALARYNSNGSLDTSFNGTGKVTTDVTSGDDYPESLAIQSDGKIIVVGKTGNGTSTDDFALARYNSNGSLDTTFNGTGRMTTDFAGGSDHANDAVVQPDGKIIAAGSASSNNCGLARYHADGTLDVTFGGAGKVSGATGRAISAALQTDGRIVVAANTSVARYLGDMAPAVTHSAPSGITANGATLNGTVNPNGLAATAQFEYGPTTAFGSTASVTLSPNNGNSAQNVGANITGLASGTQYYYRLTATNSAGASSTANGTFATLLPPAVATSSATQITTTSGTLNGTVNPNGLATTAQFQLGLTTSYGSTFPVTLSPNNGTSAQSVSAFPSGLLPGTTYHYRLTATNGNGTSTTADASFTTLSNNANLANLVPGSGALFPAFASGTTGYTTTVPFSITSITFTPTREQANSTITVNGNAVASGAASAPISLNVGGNAIPIIVTAQDGTQKTYTVIVNRAAVPGPGDRDFSFSTDGMTTTPVGASNDYGQAVAVQGDGKTVVAGFIDSAAVNDFALARYHADGTLDTSFGTGGKVTTDFAGSSDLGRAVAIQSDGRIVVAGQSYNAAGTVRFFAVARYNTDGTLDTTFDGDGKLTTPVGAGGNDDGRAVVIQPDGKIVVAGSSYNGSNHDAALVRYNSNGTLDTSFDADGKLTTAIGGGHDYWWAVALQGDGKIVAAGATLGGSHDMAVARYHANGTLDTSFNTTGKVVTAVSSGNDEAYGVVVQPDGGIVLGGYAGSAPASDFALVRCNANGSLDTGFNGTGAAVHPIGSGNDVAYGLALQRDGKLVLAGFSHNGSNNDFAVARFTSGGALDTTFNGTGKAVTAIGSSHEAAQAVALQSDGAIVAAGYAVVGGNSDFAVVRHLGGPYPPIVQTLAFSGLTTTGVTLNGTANPNGLTTTAQFEYGTTTSYGDSASVTLSPGNGTTAQTVNAGLSGLTPGTLYHYRLTATNADGTVSTSDVTFTTPAAVPEIRVFAGADDSAPELTDGQSAIVDFGSTLLGTPVLRSFTVKNVGTGNLHVTGITLPAVYERVGSPLPYDIGPNSTVTFQVRFLANTVHGAFGGTMSLTNDDADEGTFDVPVVAQATGTVISGGTLDSSFGTGGKVTTSLGPGFDAGHDVALQGDGKIVVAGWSYNGSDYDFALVRYTTSGLLDTSFGSGGKVTTTIGVSNDVGHSVVVQNDGKIVVAGYSWNGSNNDFALVRYTDTGALDTNFGSSGKVTTPIGIDNDLGFSISIQSDGKLLVAGYSWNGSNDDFALVRYNTDGGLDTSFGSGGKVTTPIGGSNDVGHSLLVRSDGHILVAGASFNGSNHDFAMVCYTATGALDASFGSGGKVITPIGTGTEEVYGMAAQVDGKIVLSGCSWNGSNYDFALVRYTATGSLDTSFGAGGKVTTPIGSSHDIGRSVAIQSDGKLLVAGYSENGIFRDFAMVRHNTNGSLDTSFGTGGKVITPVGGNDDGGESVVLQSDGKIVVVGWGNNDFALVRYNGGTVSYPAPTASTTAASAVFATTATLNGTVNPNGIITSAWFEYGTTPSYGQTTASSGVGYGTSAVNVAAYIASLTPNTLYHCRLVAQNGETTAYGADMTFLTMAGDNEGPAGGAMALLPVPPFHPSTPLTVSFTGWMDASLPLSYAVLIDDDVVISAQGSNATRNLTGPATPGTHTLKGRIYDALNNLTEVTQVFTVAPPIPNGGLVAEFAFAGNANDGIGSLHGMAHGGAALTTDRFGRAGHAFVFDGVDDYLQMPDGDALSLNTTGALSISVWVRPDGTSLNGNNDLLFSAKEGTGYVHWMGKGLPGQHEWAMRIYSADNTDVPNRVNRMSCYIFNPSGGIGTGSYAQEPLTSGQWIHHVAVMDLGSGTITWFKNGAQRDQDSFAGSITPANGTAPLRIGTRDFNSYFAGAVDDIRIYNRVLTAEEIGHLYAEALTQQAAWRQAWFGTTGNIGNAADSFDFDNDGLVNLIEWACGLNPTTANTLPATTVRNGAFIEFTYTRSKAAVNAGAVFTVEWSDTLPGPDPWSAAGVVEEVLSDDGALQQVKATIPAGSNGRRFVHLKVTAPP
ncbi:MAG: cadherin-like beta sandwich domain-containing protein [Verrucomicrobiaceae bacterium]|nr:cadherin-like beta sandwich domain-containing protein [Verrucomicrobiaceae bacterium]